MELLGKLGIDPLMLIAQIVNFSLLVVILNHWVYKPFLKRIEKEELESRKITQEEELLKKSQQNISDDTQKMEHDAKARAQKIITEAMLVAQDIKKQAQKDADAEKKAVIAQLHKRVHISYERKKTQ